MTGRTWTEDTVTRALWDKYAADFRWYFLTQVPTTGPSGKNGRDGQPTTTARYIDVLLLAASSAGTIPYERIAVEIKVSRADFFRDTAVKSSAWRGIAHKFAYCAPAGMIRPEEVPDWAGLLEVAVSPHDGSTVVRWRVRAPKNPTVEPLPLHVQHYVAGRASRAEAHIRGWTSHDAGQDPAVLARQLEDARRRVEQAEERVYREQDKRLNAEQALAQLGAHTCGICGKPIRARIHRVHDGVWQHRAHADELVCQRQRLRVATEHARAAWEALDEDTRSAFLAGHRAGRYGPDTGLEPWRYLAQSMPVLPGSALADWWADTAEQYASTVDLYTGMARRRDEPARP